MTTIARIAVAVLLALSLSACPRLAKPPAPGQPPVAAGMPSRPSVPGAVVYGIDSEHSDLHVLVYRGGPMARLGHNHVVSSRNVSGWVWLHPSLERSGFDIVLPVASLIVDDPDSRREEGADFEGDVPSDAREGTYANMLRAEVLDGEHFPRVTLKSSKVGGSLPRPVVTAEISVKAMTRSVEIPVQTAVDGRSLIVSGEFALKQTEFGMTPFSVALGALRVEDELRIKFKLRAQAPD